MKLSALALIIKSIGENCEDYDVGFTAHISPGHTISYPGDGVRVAHGTKQFIITSGQTKAPDPVPPTEPSTASPLLLDNVPLVPRTERVHGDFCC